MITQTQINELRKLEGVDWITALRPEPIRKLLENGTIQMGLFDEYQLFSFIHPDFPGERLIACRNPALAVRRAQKRQSLLDATVCMANSYFMQRLESGKAHCSVKAMNSDRAVRIEIELHC